MSKASCSLKRWGIFYPWTYRIDAGTLYPRMYLRRLEIQGFKTFAQHTVLEFHADGGRRGLTGIVGPNGSGKSNIADALRWVMGEQSLKLLRSKRSEDVIFSGTSKKPRAGFAEVNMTLVNDGRTEVDLPEVVVSRRLYRDGQSEYEINKKQVRLTDVVMLLAQCGIGQRTYSVIGQGMVDAVLVAAPAERKEFFDEAAGLRPFQLKRTASLHKLDSAQDNVKQIDLLLREIEPRLVSLERQAKRLQQRETLEAELKNIEGHYFGASWAKLKSGLATASAAVLAARTEFERKSKEAESIDQEFRVMEKAEPVSEAMKQARADLDVLRDERTKLRERQIRLESKMEVAKVVAQKPWSPLSLSKIIEEIDSVTQAHEELESLIHAVSPDMGAIKESITKLRVKSTDLLAKLQRPAPEEPVKSPVDPAIEREMAETMQALVVLTEKTVQAEKALSSLSSKEDEGRKSLFEVQHRISAKRAEVQMAERRLSDVSVESARLEARKEGFFNELRQFSPLLESEIEELAEKYGNVISNFDELRAKMSKLRSQLEWIGGIDPETIKEYEETKKRFEDLSSQTVDLKQAIAALETIIAELDKTIKERADIAFRQLDQEFSTYFKKLFNGGEAHILKVSANDDTAREEDQDELEEGIEIQATPPGKRLKAIGLLSGGERALTSIALICAIMAINPSPFVVLDEVDAALDESNSRKFAEIIDSLADRTQFVVVTHNRATMNKANVLYGVTMGEDGTSQLLSVKLDSLKGA